MTILGCCNVYQYLNESFECLTDDLEMQSMSGDLWNVVFCSKKEGLRKEEVVELCFQGSPCICNSFLYSWIEVLDLNQPFKCSIEIWEPFKMFLTWGIQSWTLVLGDLRSKSPCSRASRVCKLWMVVGWFWLGWMLVGALITDSLHASAGGYLHPRRVSYIPGAIRMLLKYCSCMLVESQIWLPSYQTIS